MPVDNLDESYQEIFMSVSVALALSKGQSFEELRVADYLKALVATGKPPLPCPPLPTSEHERMALGLLPLFKPHVEVGPSALGTVSSPDSLDGSRSGGGSTRSILDPESLPAIHIFQVVKGEAGELYQSLASQPEFLNFSHEELRRNAYAKGSIYPAMPPPSDQPPASKISSSVVPHTTTPVLPENRQDLQSISAASPYAQHSVEELRVAFIQFGRPLTSAELLQFKTPIPTGAPARTLPSFLFAAPGQSALFQSPARPF